ncbi:MAG: PEP-CTERM sorting domain-containing protein [Oscillatoriales cyanobacterium]|nr:MAG: PEP-CTERM sorting domain-containing protein [Oscillatoriales cyanobacterium]
MAVLEPTTMLGLVMTGAVGAVWKKKYG